MKELYMILSLWSFSLAVHAQTNMFDQPAVTIANLRTALNTGSIELNFTAIGETDVLYHEVQRSVNGIDFIPLGNLSPNNSGASVVYHYTDATPVAATNYYRIRSVGLSGTITYSMVTKVALGKDRTDIIILPNPVVTRHANFQLMNFEPGRYALELYNSAGVKVYSRTIEVLGPVMNGSLDLSANISTGTYQLQLVTQEKRYSRPMQVIR